MLRNMRSPWQSTDNPTQGILYELQSSQISASDAWKQRIAIVQFTANQAVSKHGSSLKTQAASNSDAKFSYFIGTSSTYCRQVIRERKTLVNDCTQIGSTIAKCQRGTKQINREKPSYLSAFGQWTDQHEFCFARIQLQLTFYIQSWMADMHNCIRGMLVYICVSYKWCQIPSKHWIGSLRRVVYSVNRIGSRTEPWGTPLSGSFGQDSVSIIFTHWLCCDR